jgi:hypothetical protein
MNAAPDFPHSFERILARVSAARFLTFSLLIHVIIVLAAGSIVLYRATDETPDFEADTGALVIDHGVAETPRETPEIPAVQEFTPQTPTVSAPLVAITTTAQSPIWKVSSASDAQIRGVSDSIKGAMGSLGKDGGMSTGDLGRLAGMRTATIFGKKVTAAKLGVILDVSGSAHPHLAGAISEIQKGFDNATLILYPGCGMMDFDGKSEHEIRKYSSITKRELEKNKGNFTTPGQIVKALKIEAFEEMTKRPSVKDKLYVSWFDEEGGTGGKLIGRTQVAFDELVKRGVDSIYWFADFADKVDSKVVQKLSSQLADRKITLHVHNFAGKKINPLITDMAENSGGTVNTETPQ